MGLGTRLKRNWPPSSIVGAIKKSKVANFVLVSFPDPLPAANLNKGSHSVITKYMVH